MIEIKFQDRSSSETTSIFRHDTLPKIFRHKSVLTFLRHDSVLKLLRQDSALKLRHEHYAPAISHCLDVQVQILLAEVCTATSSHDLYFSRTHSG